MFLTCRSITSMLVCGAIDILLLATIIYNLSSFFFLVQSNIIRNRIGFNSHSHGGQNREQSFFFTRNCINKTKQTHLYVFFLSFLERKSCTMSPSLRINHAMKRTTAKMMKTRIHSVEHDTQATHRG